MGRSEGLGFGELSDVSSKFLLFGVDSTISAKEMNLKVSAEIFLNVGREDGDFAQSFGMRRARPDTVTGIAGRASSSAIVTQE